MKYLKSSSLSEKQPFQIQNFHSLKVLKWDADSQDGRIIPDVRILKILLSGQSASRFKLQ